MKSSESPKEQDEEKRPDSNLNPGYDDLSGKTVDQNSTAAEQTNVTTEEKLPDEPLTDEERHLLYEKGIK